MSRIKAKRILCTIAFLVALSFVAAMVLHSHGEPKIIGKFSPEDVSAIAELVLKSERESIKDHMRFNLRYMRIRAFFGDIKDYTYTKVLSIEDEGTEQAMVRIGTSTNEFGAYAVLKTEGVWRATPLGNR